MISSSPDSIRILGIDPGLASLGIGIIDVKNNKCTHIYHGVISTDSSTKFENRLLSIYSNFKQLLQEFTPGTCAMEALYFSKNVTSALPVSEVRGVLKLACAEHCISIFEYSPVHIKQAIVGSGRAEKVHVQNFVRMILAMKDIPKPDHAGDALAVAITHAHTQRY